MSKIPPQITDMIASLDGDLQELRDKQNIDNTRQNRMLGQARKLALESFTQWENAQKVRRVMKRRRAQLDILNAESETLKLAVAAIESNATEAHPGNGAVPVEVVGSPKPPKTVKIDPQIAAAISNTSPIKTAVFETIRDRGPVRTHEIATAIGVEATRFGGALGLLSREGKIRRSDDGLWMLA